MIGFPKIQFEGFQGVWSRGNPDEVPNNHLVDGLNLRFNTLEGCYTREGTSSGLVFPFPINDWFLSKRPNPSLASTITDLLICDGNGNIYVGSTLAKIYNSGGATGIFGVNLFGKTYFCTIPSTGGLNVYTGGTSTRPAAGLGPPTSPSMDSSTIGSGNIPIGPRTFYCAFLTNTGFLTPLGALTPLTANPTGSYSLTLKNIPIGPATTVARYLFSVQSGGAIPYFIPSNEGGIISDNTTTSQTVNFFDTDLVESADYLLNILSQVGVSGFAQGCIFFANRLFVWPGPISGGGGSTIIASNTGDFETYDQTSCFINVNRDDGHNVVTAFVWNNVLYFCKDLGVYSTFDNGGDPDSWEVDIVDGSISVPVKGIAYLSTQQNPVAGGVIIADKTGLIAFNGSFQRPELTWKVEGIWKRINKNAWNTLNLSIDPLTHSIYCAVPLDLATSPNYILYGDYSMALDEDLLYVDPMKIKWDLWQFPAAPTVVGMVDLNDEPYPILRIGSIKGIGSVIQLDTTQTVDFNDENIQSFMQTAYGFLAKSRTKNSSDFNSFFAGIKWNGYGTSLMTATGFGYNGKIQRQLFTRQLLPSISVDLMNPINFTSQKLSVKLGSSSGQFTINSIILYAKPMFMVTPQ